MVCSSVCQHFVGNDELGRNQGMLTERTLKWALEGMFLECDLRNGADH